MGVAQINRYPRRRRIPKAIEPRFDRSPDRHTLRRGNRRYDFIQTTVDLGPNHFDPGTRFFAPHKPTFALCFLFEPCVRLQMQMRTHKRKRQVRFRKKGELAFRLLENLLLTGPLFDELL
ncbi:MAG: hypothetical protein KatS3mg117_3260 [Geminicoccaceae bacterium]|nr:MAG: hypothetical protein KatS3mg117_3260 [Geminicoccaceae bacterium]